VGSGEAHLFYYTDCSVLPDPSKRDGRKRLVFNNAKAASKVIPTNRKGIERSQTMGKATSASKARGQHKTRRMHQPTNARMKLMLKKHTPR
jgi:hypothetical protein